MTKAGRRGRAWMAAGAAIVTIAGSVAVAGSLAAHDTWLLPASVRVPVGAPVRLAMTSGMAFPARGAAIAPERVREALIRLAGERNRLDAAAGDSALWFTATPSRAGVATLWVTLEPRSLELTPAQVAEYLDEIGAGAAVRERWAGMAEPRQWRETYVKLAKTFVAVGTPPADDRSWAIEVGQTLELVPQRDPTALRRGDTLGVRVLRAGVPFRDAAVGVVGGDGAARLVRTDANGVARIALEGAGPWLVRCTDLRPGTGLSPWQSDFATLTLAAGAE